MKKRVVVLFCFLAAMLLTVCGCGASDNDTASEPETVKEKVYYAAFEVPKGWKEKMVERKDRLQLYIPEEMMYLL